MLKPVVKPADLAHLAPHSPSEPEVTPLDDSSSSDVWLLVSETNGPVGAPSAPPCVPPRSGPDLGQATFTAVLPGHEAPPLVDPDHPTLRRTTRHGAGPVGCFLSLSLRALTLLPLLREAAVSLGPWSCAGGEPHTVVGGPVGTYVGLCGVSAALGNAFCSFCVASSSSVANLIGAKLRTAEVESAPPFGVWGTGAFSDCGTELHLPRQFGDCQSSQVHKF
uniref:Uncharacterized protein n=1 Tax=Knipowitschia caucasica TaxID=637954 RepID=A0AAV2LEZ7_KNICA